MGITMDDELAKLGEKAEQMNADDLKVIDVDIESKEVNNNTTTETTTTNTTASSSSKNNAKKADNKKKKNPKKELIRDVTKLQTELKEMELDLIQQVLAAVGPKRAIGVRNALLGDISVRGSGSLLSSMMEERPLSTLIKTGDHGRRQKSLFVMN